MGGKSLSAEDVALVKQMALLGHSHRVIALRVGRTKSAVRNILCRGKGYTMGRACSDCPNPIRNENVSGRCKSCATAYNNRLPETKAKRVAGWKKRMADPLKYARLCATLADNARKGLEDPVKRAAAAERGRLQYERYLNNPEVRALLNSPEMRAAKGKKITAARLAWCPPEYRAEYLYLIYTKRMHRSEAKPIILEQVRADRERELAKLSPFERQMRALEKGATLVANDQKPSLANPGYHEERKAG